jgi:hypothetical protein
VVVPVGGGVVPPIGARLDVRVAVQERNRVREQNRRRVQQKHGPPVGERERRDGPLEENDGVTRVIAAAPLERAPWLERLTSERRTRHDRSS